MTARSMISLLRSTFRMIGCCCSIASWTYTCFHSPSTVSMAKSALTPRLLPAEHLYVPASFKLTPSRCKLSLVATDPTGREGAPTLDQPEREMLGVASMMQRNVTSRPGGVVMVAGWMLT